jgi:GNAT superfamily N-acetyltransferase
VNGRPHFDHHNSHRDSDGTAIENSVQTRVSPVTEPWRWQDVSAAARDQQCLYTWYKTLLRPHIEPIYGWDETFQRQRFAEHYLPKDGEFLFVRGRQVGARFVQQTEEGLYLILLLIDPRHQRGGYGRLAVSELQITASLKQQPVILSCFRSNISAIRLYRSLGFETERVEPHFLQMRWQA